MAKKLYLFGIGGTGSRVIKSLVMLFAAGVKLSNDFETVVPILIDPDTDNGDLNRTKDILRLYQEIRSQVKNPEDFYRQELKTVQELADAKSISINPDYFQFKLKDVDNTTFGQYIGFDALCDDFINGKDDKSFVRLLYSASNLNSDLSVGFKGNPNMGSIVLNQFTNSEDFKRFGQTFEPDDAIFIINSIFGGTGAAGFPLLLKNLRGNSNLLNYARIKDAPIGGVTYLPYFTMDKKGEINAETFEEKAKIALDYYNRTIIKNHKINVLHFLGNRGNTNAEEYAVGGSAQKNKAHFLEIAGALAVLDFCKCINSYSCENGQTKRPTEIKEFGVERSGEVLSFDDLNLENKEQIYKPLTKFRLFTQYLFEGLERAKNVSRWTKSNFWVLPKEKRSTLDADYFESSEYKNQIAAFNRYYKEWLDELSKNKPSFNPFQDNIPSKLFSEIDTENCLNIDKLKYRPEIDPKSKKFKYFHSTLVKLFGISTEKIYKDFPINFYDKEKNIKVFRLHEGQEGTGWFISELIDKNKLKTIKTEGNDVASSIPSPFARMDLVKSAFDWINYRVSSIIAANTNGGQLSRDEKIKIKNVLEGNSAQNKLISEAFDVAQLFYKSQSLKNKIEIVAWDPINRFSELISNNNNTRNAQFAGTLKIFWEQDSVSLIDQGNIVLYNFEHVNRLFFVINSNTKQVIGGTSPATLFYSAPDGRDAIRGLNITSGEYRLFGGTYSPLHRRDPSFIEYMYAFAKQSQEFSSRFPEVNTYLDHIKKYLLEEDKQTVVSNIQSHRINEYNNCTVTYDDKDNCEIINLRLGVEESLLEDKIIELPYSIDATKFITCGAKKHLIPVTKAFVRRYGINNIERYCRLEERAGGGIEVILTVPVQNNKSLEHRKLYHLNDIVKANIHLAIFPFLTTTTTPIEYTMGIVDDRSDKSDGLSLGCLYNGTDIQQSSEPIVRNPASDDEKSTYYKYNYKFDTIVFGIGNIKNIIVPRLFKCSENESASFAIDFGTTNTHIEYSIGAKSSVPFENIPQIPLWQSLINKTDRSTQPEYLAIDSEFFEKEMLPYAISTKGSEVSFPLRTAIVFNRDYKFSTTEPYRLFQHVNNYLLFEKKTVPNYLKADTHLKWTNYGDSNDELRVSAYIDYLLTIVYHKTLLLGANPAKTKIFWFYPVSMEGAENSGGELGIFIRIWKDAYIKIFKAANTNNFIQIPESIPPYLYYKHEQTTGLSLSIDIGGGSSDIAVFDEKDTGAKLISSFKFAGNAIFGDGYLTEGEKGSSDSNGWVTTFKEDAENIAGKDYKGILDDILARKDSADFSNFLFSLENNPANNFSYTRLIERNKNLKLTMMVFYGAIAFYSANLLKKSNIDIPKNILLSGTASKTASMLDSSSDSLSNLSSLFKYIFEKVYGEEINREITLKVARNPKELTCKGALGSGIGASIRQNTIKFWLGGINGGIWGAAIDRAHDVENTPKYEEINDDAKSSITDAIQRFYALMDQYKGTVLFNTNFLISEEAYAKFKEIRDNDIRDFMERGLKAFYKKGNSHIEETLFFYPMVGILNRLTYELSKI